MTPDGVGDQIVVEDVGDLVLGEAPASRSAVTSSICSSRPMDMNSTRTSWSTWSECI